MIFDAIVLAAVIISSVIAFLRGFIRELLTIVGVVGGLAASYFGGPILTTPMRGWLGVTEGKEKEQKLFDVVPMDIVAAACAYGAIFIVVVIVLSVLSHFLASGAKAVGLGPIDRIMGILFGVARALLMVCLLYLPIFLLTEPKERETWGPMKDSKSLVYVERGAKMIADLLPENTEDTVDDATEQANQKMDETRKRLEDMDVLKDAAGKAENAMDKVIEALPEQPPQPQQPDAPGAQGYAPEQREKLDELLNETTGQQAQ